MARCVACSCDKFSRVESILQSVENDKQTEELGGWLSGRRDDGQGNGTGETPSISVTIDSKQHIARERICPGTLQAAVVVLNAIRDACRMYIEPAWASPNKPNTGIASSKQSPAIASKSNELASQDSFPPLVSTESTCNFLVGRKKGQPKLIRHPDNMPTYENSFPALSPANADKEPTILVARKKSKGKDDGFAIDRRNAKAKKKITPITISSSSAFAQPSFRNNKIEGNISVLPSQETTVLTIEESSALRISLPRNGDGRGTTVTTEPLVTSPSRNLPQCVPFDPDRLRRLATIYSTILKANLAPFMLQEIHLLVRLISLNERNRSTRKAQLDLPYAEIFQSENSCVRFAAQVFTSVERIIICTGDETVRLLATLPGIQRNCPQLHGALVKIAKADSGLLLESGEKTLGSSNSAHLTLPFDHGRDSRHNYKSVEQNKLYKEREETRDAFLHQLRTFQDMRGKLMDPEQSHKVKCSIESASRMITSRISAENMKWFVDLFCDLLLQIGLTPLSETDTEIIKQIGDRKKVHKLHSRFTSTSSQASSRSSGKLHLNTETNRNMQSVPDQSFAGHQEFFYIFIRAADSYTFNTHLKHHLLRLLQDLNATNQVKGLCDHMAKTQMVALFLGLLVFSPNWSVPSCLHQVLPSFDLLQCIEDGWVHRRLIIVIPWVVQFLSMLKWDESSKKSEYYRAIFSFLWSVYHHCNVHLNQEAPRSNMALVSFQLAPLFSNTIGLVSSYDLRMSTLPTQSPELSAKLTAFDTKPIFFTRQYLFLVTPFLKDLHELVNLMARGGGKSSTGSAKKVRPSSIGGLFRSISFGERSMSPWSGNRPGTPTYKSNIRERLVDAFFHQHKDLQKLCDTLVDQSVKNFTSAASDCIHQMFMRATSYDEYFNSEPCMTLDGYVKLLQSLEADARESLAVEMTNCFDRVIGGSLKLLVAPGTCEKVTNIASSLATSHGRDKGTKIVSTALKAETKNHMDEFVRKQKKQTVESATPRVVSDHSPGDTSPSCSPELSLLLKRLRSMETSQAELDCLVRKCTNDFEKSACSPGALGAELSEQIKTMLLEPKSIDSITCVAAALEVLCTLNKLGYSSSGTRDICSYLNDPENLSTLVRGSSKETKLPVSMVTSLLFNLIEGGLVNHRPIEDMLLRLMDVDVYSMQVSSDLLRRLALDACGASDWQSGGLASMVRLQRKVRRSKNRQLNK